MSTIEEGEHIASPNKNGNVRILDNAELSPVKYVVSNKKKLFRWHMRALEKREMEDVKCVCYGKEKAFSFELHSIKEMEKEFRTNSNFHKLQKYTNSDLPTMDYEVYARKCWYHCINEMVKSSEIWYGKHTENVVLWMWL